MTVTCNECGASYEVDPDKMIAPSVRFKCQTCDNYVMANKEDLVANLPEEDVGSSFEEPEVSQVPTSMIKTKIKGFGIRSKLLLFLILFIVSFAVQGYYLILQLNKIFRPT